jgi:hypothetical protein
VYGIVDDDRKNIITVAREASGSGKSLFAVRVAAEQAVLKVAASKTMILEDMKSVGIIL